jgi:bacterioferritin-associated ferredoxin
MIVCICRGKSERDVMAAIENGASSIRELQHCGIGDQCGSCHTSLRGMLLAAAAADAARQATDPLPVVAATALPALTPA